MGLIGLELSIFINRGRKTRPIEVELVSKGLIFFLSILRLISNAILIRRAH